MKKVTDIRHFDRGQILMAWWLGTSISKVTRLIRCSRVVIVSTYEKGDTSSMWYLTSMHHQKWMLAAVLLGEAKLRVASGWSDCWIQCRREYEHLWDYKTVTPSVNQSSSSFMSTVGLGTLWVEHETELPGWMNHYPCFIMSVFATKFASF